MLISCTVGWDLMNSGPEWDFEISINPFYLLNSQMIDHSNNKVCSDHFQKRAHN
jgi:hypothetical protein